MKWYDKDNNIILEDLDDLITIANTKQFGETGMEDLDSWLSCEAFERRFDPEDSRCLSLAARIIRIVTYMSATGELVIR
ncbi:MAG: hypothetical protein GY861_22285 [bacterium]|nr:hypothetical protein [bacterium]